VPVLVGVPVILPLLKLIPGGKVLAEEKVMSPRQFSGFTVDTTVTGVPLVIVCVDGVKKILNVS
jgi:hypothetical protein